jgi:hypothetical protein
MYIGFAVAKIDVAMIDSQRISETILVIYTINVA